MDSVKQKIASTTLLSQLPSSLASSHHSSTSKHDSGNLSIAVVPPQNNDDNDINMIIKPPPSAYSAPPLNNSLFIPHPPPPPPPSPPIPSPPPNSHYLLTSQPNPNQNNDYAIPLNYHQSYQHTVVKMEEGEVSVPPWMMKMECTITNGSNVNGNGTKVYGKRELGPNNHHPKSWHGGYGRGGYWNEYTGSGPYTGGSQNWNSRGGGMGQSHYHPYPPNPYHSAPSMQHVSYYPQSRGTNGLNQYRVGGGNYICHYNPNRVNARMLRSSSGIPTQTPASYPYHHHHQNIHFGANNPIHAHPLEENPMHGKAMHMSHSHSYNDGIALGAQSERVPAMSAQGETECLHHQHQFHVPIQTPQPQLQMPFDSSTELFNKLPHELKRIPHNTQSDKLWVLECDCVRVIEEGGEVGFLASFLPQELDALFGVFGILRKKVPVNVCLSRRNGKGIDMEKKKSQKCRLQNTSGMTIEKEVLCDYKCECKLCKVVARVARINCDGVTALLVYQLSDKTSALPFDHNKSAHKLTQQEEQNAGLRINSSISGRPRYGDFGLSVEQKQFIIDSGTCSNKKGAFSDIATMMTASEGIRCSEAQLTNPEKLEEKVKEFVSNRRRACDYFFTKVWGKCDMSGQQFCEILDILKTPMENRISCPCISNHPDNFHLLTPDFRMTM
jgi:hypothetical protein